MSSYCLLQQSSCQRLLVFAQWSLHFLEAEGSSKPPTVRVSIGVGGLACETGEAEAHHWGLTVSANQDIMLSAQAGPLQA